MTTPLECFMKTIAPEEASNRRLQLALEYLKAPQLQVVGFRVPLRGELYLDKNDRIQRLDQDRVQSKHAKKKLVLREHWPEHE